MRWARWIILLLIAAAIGAVLHYNLPQRDVVRVVETTEIRIDFSAWNRPFYTSGDSGGGTNLDQRDIRFIRTIRPDGRPSVYRNEDTGWFGWPPYFKTDSEDLQTEAGALVSDADSPDWVLVTHYGWRSNPLSIYPNAISIRPGDGPDDKPFPWSNIIVLALLVLAGFALWRLWERFEERVVVPIVDGVLVRWAKLKDWVRGR